LALARVCLLFGGAYALHARWIRDHLTIPPPRRLRGAPLFSCLFDYVDGDVALF
jgi:hypothetical protein